LSEAQLGALARGRFNFGLKLREWERKKAEADALRARNATPLDIALENAIASRELILPAQAEIEKLKGDAQDELEIKAREYQQWLVAAQLNRAADYALLRRDYLAKLKTPADIAEENARCKRDILHWFKYWAWSLDPRPDAPLALMPLVPFGFQERFLKWLDWITFGKRSSGVCEKSRDMGATEFTLRWCLHHWLYSDGFAAMLLSDIEDKVDSKKDPNTLFEKERIQIRLLPDWMLPKGFERERDMPYMLIANPENGSTLVGNAPTASAARQGRATFILADEFAFWRSGGFEHYTAMSQTAKTIFMPSSVNGEFNKFADLAHDGRTPKFEMDWREHEWKTEVWYESLPYGYIGAAMSPQEIAQEVDRDYKASQPGLVFRNRKDEYLFFTLDEVVSYYKTQKRDAEFYDRVGRFRIPHTWSWSRQTDVGATEGHRWAYLIAARPPESWSLSDTVFVFVAENLERIGASPDEAHIEMVALERRVGLRDERGVLVRRPTYSDMSHEEAAQRRHNRAGYIDTFRQVFGENFSPMQTSYDVGIPLIRSWFDLTDRHKPNPFRPSLNGRCKIVFVSLDNDYSCVFNEQSGSWFVTASQSESGFRTLRAQLSAYHYPIEERGKPLKKMRPEAIFDDIISCLKGMALRYGPALVPLTQEEKAESMFTPNVAIAAIAAEEDASRRMLKIQARALQRVAIERELDGETASRDALSRYRRSLQGG